MKVGLPDAEAAKVSPDEHDFRVRQALLDHCRDARRLEARKVVAHVLVAKVRDGWRVAGLNNRSHDMEPVLAENLVGVVIAAFQPLPTARVQLAALSR